MYTKPSVFKQTFVYIKKNTRIFFNQNDWKFIAISAVISVLVCNIIEKDMYKSYEDTQAGFFAIISACIWIGTFNAIQRICKEHATITSEYRAGLHLSAYIFSHVFVDLLLCLAQALILCIISMIYIDFPSDGVIIGFAIEYIITLFLVVFGADLLGLAISAIVSTPNAAMTTMPFVLIMQLLMSGVLFQLQGWSKSIANITYSKWGMSALGNIGGLNDPDLPYKITIMYPNAIRITMDSAYEHTKNNLLTAWGYMIIIASICIAVSIIALKIRNRKA